MNISVSEAAKQLADLVRRAEAGEEIVLTSEGKPVARIEVEPKSSTSEVAQEEASFVYTEAYRKTASGLRTADERLAAIDAISRAAAGRATPGPDAAHSQDFLYDENGLPG